MKKMKTLIVTATSEEMAYVSLMMSENIHLRAVGVGEKLFKKNLKIILTTHSYDQIVYMGGCGAINPTWKTGDIVVPYCFSCQGYPDINIQTHNIRSLILNVKFGKIITSSFSLMNSFMKSQQKDEFDVVDMESYYFVEIAQDFKIPCRVIKTVIDPWNQQFPSIDLLVENYQSIPFKKNKDYFLKDSNDWFHWYQLENCKQIAYHNLKQTAKKLKKYWE